MDKKWFMFIAPLGFAALSMILWNHGYPEFFVGLITFVVVFLLQLKLIHMKHHKQV